MLHCRTFVIPKWKEELRDWWTIQSQADKSKDVIYHSQCRCV
jgi:hypothetical protein